MYLLRLLANVSSRNLCQAEMPLYDYGKQRGIAAEAVNYCHSRSVQCDHCVPEIDALLQF